MKLFDIAKEQKRPVFAAAPMVRYSKVGEFIPYALHRQSALWRMMQWTFLSSKLRKQNANLQKLAFRETVAHYGVDLTWTPMV